MRFEYLKWICGFTSAQGKTWDRLVEEKATLQDIDKSSVDFFKKEAASAGRLPDIANLSIEDLFKKFLVKPVRFDGLRRVEELEYPVPIETYKKAGLPDPIIEERNGWIAVELLKTPVSGPDDSDRCRNDFGMMSERIRNDVGSETARVFEIICQQPECTTEQIAKKTGKATRTIERYISKLKKAGLITRQGPKLGGYWEIKK